MSFDRSVNRIAVIGTGVIGASWTTQFLAKGFDVVATDPAPGAEQKLREFVVNNWETATRLGLEPGASVDRLSFTPVMSDAVAGADFVQENAPERPEFKIKLFAEIDEAAPVDALIASSSSGITMSVIQSACAHPERTVIGHPVNPPHLMPLVEVVGGEKTSPDAIDTAMAFYASIGKRPILLLKELPGHAVNRLQSALYREVVDLIDQGVLSVADADDAVCWGPGLRWGVMGQSLLWHLGGGEGGIQHFMDHLMGPLVDSWATLRTPVVTDELKQTIVDGVLGEAGGRSIDELEQLRDEMLLGLLDVRARAERTEPIPS
jgi:carnitine 3-dehydrogenase